LPSEADIGGVSCHAVGIILLGAFFVATGPGSVLVAIFAMVVAVPTMMSAVLVMFVVSMTPVSMMLAFVPKRRMVVNCIVPIATS
jgi:hypothetical protein